MITNGTNSYAVFTYECGDINWGGGATIGYKATGGFYQNHAYSGSSAASIDCVNSPTSQWNNVIYNLNGNCWVLHFSLRKPRGGVGHIQGCLLLKIKVYGIMMFGINKTCMYSEVRTRQYVKPLFVQWKITVQLCASYVVNLVSFSHLQSD